MRPPIEGGLRFQTSRSSPLLTSLTSSFHSACDSRTVFVSSPIVTPLSVISTSGHSVQFGHRVNLTFSIGHTFLLMDCQNPTICSHYRGKPYLTAPLELAIGELSRRTQCNIETIRYYERIGLLPKPRRTGGRYRRYVDEDV